MSGQTLRRAMYGYEGEERTEFQIERGRRAWAIERRGACQPRGCARLIVFGTCRSDALRAASAPARLAEEVHDDVTLAVEIASGWDAPFSWPSFEEANAR